AEEADGHLIAAAHFAGKSRAGSHRRAAPHNGIRAQIARILVRDMHGTTFAAAVASFLTQQFGEHAVNGGSLCQAMAVPAMRAGDIVIATQGGAYSHSYRLLANVEMSQAGHFGAKIQLVHMLFKNTDFEHLLVHR